MAFLLEEIRKGPSAVLSAAKAVTGYSGDIAEKVLKAGKVAFIGSGSSYNAALPAVWLLNRLGFPARAVQASDVKEFGLPRDTASILVSVSGRGDDILGAAKRVFGTAVISNTEDAPLLKLAETSILLGLDPQKAEAATHTFVGVMTALLWLALDIVEGKEEKAKRAAKQEKAVGLLDEVALCRSILTEKMPQLMENALGHAVEMREKMVKMLAKEQLNLSLVGFGPSYAAALDGALKIKEVAQVFAEAHEGDNVLHGPSYPIAFNKVPAIVLGSYIAHKASRRVSRILSELGSPVMYLRADLARGRSDEDERVIFQGEEERDFASTAEDLSELFIEALLPLTSVIPLQIMAYYLGVERGIDPDIPPTKRAQIEALCHNC